MPTPSEPIARFTDENALPNEREWSVESALGGGLKVRTYDDSMALFDEVTLRRFGAFVVIDMPPTGPVPEWLAFMRPAIECQRRMRSLGLLTPLPPVLVHRESMQRLLDNGHFPSPLKSIIEEHGTAILYGVRVVWSRELDQHAL